MSEQDKKAEDKKEEPEKAHVTREDFACLLIEMTRQTALLRQIANTQLHTMLSMRPPSIPMQLRDWEHYEKNYKNHQVKMNAKLKQEKEAKADSGPTNPNVNVHPKPAGQGQLRSNLSIVDPGKISRSKAQTRKAKRSKAGKRK